MTPSGDAAERSGVPARRYARRALPYFDEFEKCLLTIVFAVIRFDH